MDEVAAADKPVIHYLRPCCFKSMALFKYGSTNKNPFIEY